MPGISLIACLQAGLRDDMRNDLVRMVGIQKHYQDYQVSSFEFLDSRAVTANLSLSISDFPLQEYCNKEAGITVLVGGEIVNSPDLKRIFHMEDHVCSSNSAEVVFQLYRKHPDLSFLPDLDGWFNIEIYDRNLRRLILASDRWGIQPWYFAEHAGRLLLAPEVKGILAALPCQPKLDLNGVRDFLVFGGMHDERTLFEGIRRFPAASIWILDLETGYLEKSFYWEAHSALNLPKINDTEAREFASETFSRLIQNYLRDPYYLCLTGGWDTRTIISFVGQDNAPQRNVTYGLIDKSSDISIARRVSSELGIPHQAILCDKSLFDNFMTYAENSIYLTDGMGNISLGTVLFNYEKLINHICVTGKYGTQVFANGMPPSMVKPNVNIVSAISQDFIAMPERYPKDKVQSLLQSYADAEFKEDVYLLLSIMHECRQYWGANLALESKTNLIRSPYLSNKWIDCLMRIHPRQRCAREIQSHIIRRHGKRVARIPTDKGGLPLSGDPWSIAQAYYYKARYLATIVINSRRLSPLLRLDNSRLAKNTNNNINHWLRGHLGSFLREVLLDTRTRARGIYDIDKVESMIHDHMSRQCDYGIELQRLLSFELFIRRFVDVSFASEIEIIGSSTSDVEFSVN